MVFKLYAVVAVFCIAAFGVLSEDVVKFRIPEDANLHYTKKPITSEKTCNVQCQVSDDALGCCPFEHGVCCGDRKNCCPKSTFCDNDSGVCRTGLWSVFFAMKPLEVKSKNVKSESPKAPRVTFVCPDMQSTCASGETCCKTVDDTYGCCSYAYATCCSDRIHCCEQNYSCDLQNQRCVPKLHLFQDGKMPPAMMPLKKTKISPRKQKPIALLTNPLLKNICPGGKTYCEDQETCCPLSNDVYGCCPTPKASCCSDGQHCCPENYICDSSNRCFPKEADRPGLPVFDSVAALTKKAGLKVVICPDTEFICPDNNTCCILDNGQYGCCPLPNAVCCKDHVHCCPADTTCNLADQSCNSPTEKVPMSRKTKATKLNEKKDLEGVLCPDKQSTCPDGSTCCALASGQFGCCPIANAVCCSDHVHCCPTNTKCNLAKGTCDNSVLGSVPMSRKTKATKLNEKKDLEGVLCPDKQSTCPDGSTCCALASGQFGCCPLANAVCCNDGQHCCPADTVCNTVAQRCDKKYALTADEAVCCKDGLHCCPSNTVCNATTKTCERKQSVPLKQISRFPNDPTTIHKLSADSNEMCPDGTSSCSNGETCCKQADGSYACCPLPKAVCCSDQIHCCPEGTTCNTSQQTCDKKGRSVAMSKKVPAQFVTEKSKLDSYSIVCPDQASVCQSGTTCCKLPQKTKYSCCPLANAVCCSDGVHCCPTGSRCNLVSQRCDSTNGDFVNLPWKMSRSNQESSLTKKAFPPIDVTPEVLMAILDSERTPKQPQNAPKFQFCPGAKKACKNAVCCSIGYGRTMKNWCCPSGLRCSTKEGTCV